MATPKIIVFDSGFGGLTVYRELKASLPDANYLYVADNAAFPYGAIPEDELVKRLLVLFDMLIKREKPDMCVIACNTASTIALAPLRAVFDVPFVGTVPAIRTAAQKTSSGLFSVLATPGTVKRQYIKDLIKDFAGSSDVTLVGAPDLAALAENFMRGKAIDGDQLAQIIKPAFVEKQGQRTDIVVLGCTHYPLLTKEIRKVAPWPVTYIDPAPAIARRAKVVLLEMAGMSSKPDAQTANRLIYTGRDDIVGNIGGFLERIDLHSISRDEIIGLVT